jgi:O-antigen/teichoic acid export membrane protein
VRFPGNFRNLFLFDGLGALITTLLLWLLVAPLESFFGMPSQIVEFLALIAACFAIYSFSCSLLIRRDWKPFLKVIALANLGYCLLTFSLLIYYREEVLLWGWIYFLGEIIIVISLGIYEWKFLRSR